jgi:hypothetical protein
MLTSLEDSNFFSAADLAELRSFGIEMPTGDHRLAMAALMLSPLLELSTDDRVTSPSEFEAIEDFLQKLEADFELATLDEIEALGTEMGMLPMVPGSWDRSRFSRTRQLLARSLDRMLEKEAHAVRNAIAAGCLAVATAEGGHLISLHRVSDKEKPLVAEIVESLKLDTTSEGLRLLERAGLR